MKCKHEQCEAEATRDATVIVVEEYASMNDTHKLSTKLCEEHAKELRNSFGFDFI